MVGTKTTGRVADLSALAAQLEADGGDKKLANAIKNASRAQSCIADLTLAQQTMEALAQLSASGWIASPIHRLAAEHALLANTLMLYARATSVGAKLGERGHTSIRDRLNDADRRDHDQLIEIRSTAVAHVAPDHIIDGDLWHREAAFAVEMIDGRWVPAAMTRRVQTHGSCAQILRRLMPKAEQLLRDTYHKRLNYVTQALQALPQVGEKLASYPLDANDLFGSEEEAYAALSDPGRGRSVGMINDGL